MSKTAPVWAAFRLKRLVAGGRVSHCILKTDDGKDCIYFHEQEKGDSATSTLISHVKKNHSKVYEKLFNKTVNRPAQKKISTYAITEEELQIKADVEIIEYISRRNETFSAVEDPLIYSLLVSKFGANYVKKMDYYRTTGLTNASKHWDQKVENLIKNKEIACTTDLWSNLSSDFSLIVITATYFEGWERRNIILSCQSIQKPHNAAKIQSCLKETFCNMNIDLKNIVFITRDDGSDVKKACADLSITSAQCGPHAFNNIVQPAFTGDVEKEYLPKLKKKAQTLASSFCKKAARRQMLTAAQKVYSLRERRIPRIIDVRWNSNYLCFNGIVENEKALLQIHFDGETIYLEKDDFIAIKEAVTILKYFYDKTLELSKPESFISEIIPSFKKLKTWIDTVAKKSSKYKCASTKALLEKLSNGLGKKLENYGKIRYITSSMALDPRFIDNKNYLKETEWCSADKNIILYLVKDGLNQELFSENDDAEVSSPNISVNTDGSNSSIDPDELDQRRTTISKKSNTTDIREEIKKELLFVKQRMDPNIKPLVFYEQNEHHLPNISKAAKHFFLATSSSVESESFFSDATLLYGNKQRNRLSAESAQKLLKIRVMQKRNVPNFEKNDEESEESDSGEEF